MAACLYSVCSNIGSCIAYVLCCKCCRTRSVPVAPFSPRSQSHISTSNVNVEHPRDGAVANQFCRYLPQAVGRENLAAFDHVVQHLNQIGQSPQGEIALIIDATKGRIIGYNNKLPNVLGYEQEDALLDKSVMEFATFTYSKWETTTWDAVVGIYFAAVDKRVPVPFHITLTAHRTGQKAFMPPMTIKHLDIKPSEPADRKDNRKDSVVGIDISDESASKTNDYIRKYPYLLLTLKPQFTTPSRRSLLNDGTVALHSRPAPGLNKPASGVSGPEVSNLPNQPITPPSPEESSEES